MKIAFGALFLISFFIFRGVLALNKEADEKAYKLFMEYYKDKL